MLLRKIIRIILLIILYFGKIRPADSRFIPWNFRRLRSLEAQARTESLNPLTQSSTVINNLSATSTGRVHTTNLLRADSPEWPGSRPSVAVPAATEWFGA